jgi:hypothetical protein
MIPAALSGPNGPRRAHRPPGASPPKRLPRHAPQGPRRANRPQLPARPNASLVTRRRAPAVPTGPRCQPTQTSPASRAAGPPPCQPAPGASPPKRLPRHAPQGPRRAPNGHAAPATPNAQPPQPTRNWVRIFKLPPGRPPKRSSGTRNLLQTRFSSRETDFFSFPFQPLTNTPARIAGLRMVVCGLGRPPSQSGRDGTKNSGQSRSSSNADKPPGGIASRSSLGRVAVFHPQV